MWFAWLLIALSVFNIIGGILLVGEERKTRTPADAAIGAILNGLVIVGIVYYFFN